jgi:uncharacterized membrane-anchored protein
MKRALITIGVLWLVAILAFVGYNEFTRFTGQEVVLRTAPVDPTDLFRGDYIILNYEINRIDLNTLAPSEQFVVGDTVYVTVAEQDGFAQAVAASKLRPDAPLFIRGTIEWLNGGQAQLNYGINSYFVPQGTGRPLERATNMTVRVYLDDRGEALVKELLIDGEPVRLETLQRE